MSEPASPLGTLILILIGILITYYCRRNGFMVSQSLVFINFSIFATWWILFLLKPSVAIQALLVLGFQPIYLESPGFGLLTLISAMFMHGGPMHLLMNMLILILLGVPFEDRIGSRSFLKIYLLFWVSFVKKNKEKIYSFQIIINIIKKVTNNPLLTCGNKIFHQIFICVAPSIFA